MEQTYNEEFSDMDRNLEGGMSIEDCKAKEIMDQSTTLVNGHYHIRLPLCDNFPNLPDSLTTAGKRLIWLEQKMQRDPVYHKNSKYSSVTEKDRTEGSSKQVTDDHVAKLNPIWYLPHHAL